jgi:hypothetical protein
MIFHNFCLGFEILNYMLHSKFNLDGKNKFLMTELVIEILDLFFLLRDSHGHQSI